MRHYDNHTAPSILPRWGVHPTADGTWEAALWAPSAQAVDLVAGSERIAMTKDDGGTFRAAAALPAGTPYGFDLGNGPRPDPAARAQLGDVHGLSVLVSDDFDWPDTEAQWAGRPWRQAVILEIHIGLFTPEGTFRAAMARLPELRELGITAIEIMPVAQFSGRRGWGYDGVLPFAPHNAYGTPADLKALVAAAHSLGIAVILDVVYNHFGPDGAYLHETAPEFFDPDRNTPWGAGINYAAPAVREFFLSNVAMWIGEYHMDGLRIDAAHQIKDASEPDMLSEIARAARAAGGDREIWMILEDERNIVEPVAPGAGLFDAQWNDDFHHALHCLLTGEAESYYEPFAADPMADLLKALSEGQVDQGQPRPATDHPRGEPSVHLPPTAFVNSCQTHDQVGNRARGERLIALTSEPAAQCCHALLLLSPFIPMLFMGEEAGEEAPFCFFADFPEPMAEATRKGRQREFERFESFKGQVPDPIARETFDMSRPYGGAPERIASWHALTQRLLVYRATRIVPLLATAGPIGAAATVTQLGARGFEAEWRFPGGRLILRAGLGGAPVGEGDGVWDMTFGTLATDSYALAVRCQWNGED